MTHPDPATIGCSVLTVLLIVGGTVFVVWGIEGMRRNR